MQGGGDAYPAEPRDAWVEALRVRLMSAGSSARAASLAGHHELRSERFHRVGRASPVGAVRRWESSGSGPGTARPAVATPPRPSVHRVVVGGVLRHVLRGVPVFDDLAAPYSEEADDRPAAFARCVDVVALRRPAPAPPRAAPQPDDRDQSDLLLALPGPSRRPAHDHRRRRAAAANPPDRHPQQPGRCTAAPGPSSTSTGHRPNARPSPAARRYGNTCTPRSVSHRSPTGAPSEACWQREAESASSNNSMGCTRLVRTINVLMREDRKLREAHEQTDQLSRRSDPGTPDNHRHRHPGSRSTVGQWR